MTYLNQFNNEFHIEIIKLCHYAKLQPHNFVRGCKLFDNYQRVSLIVLFIQSKKSLRDFVRDETDSLLIWKHRLQLKKIPSKSTLHLWLKTISLSFIRKLLEFTIKDETPQIVAIDGSGVDSYYQSSYYQKRLSDFGVNKPKSSWHKLDIIVDVKSKMILDFSFLLYNRHDSKVAWQLFNRFNLKNFLILADKGYYWFKLYNLIKEKEGILIVPPKNYGKKCLHNRIVRREFHNSYYEYEEFYNLRNNVESVFSSLKRVQGLKIKSKLHYMKKREIGWHIVWYNIRKKLSYEVFFIIILIIFSQKLRKLFNKNYN